MRLIRRLMLAMAIAASATLLIPTGSAQAGYPEGRICFPIGTPGTVTLEECHDFAFPLIEPNRPWPPDWCIYCNLSFDFGDDKLDAKTRLEYLDQLGRGLDYLAEATLTQDPKTAKGLREQATQILLSSATLLGKSQIDFAGIGWTDLESGKFYGDPDPQPMMEAVGKDLAAGLQLMQQALGDPQPEPNIQAAMERFDEAYSGLAMLHAG